ncbi:MAG TPA: stage II sporulation protein M [Anaerolineaceae bacterium]|nr:stage II sporulation protein M [Anaerolineaceae bacterium]
MWASFQPALIVARREVRDQFRDWRIIFPIVGLTVFFPFLMNFTATQILDFVKAYGANIIGERLVPFLMMIVGFFPISVSLVIALESFVGEKERGSIEPLLATPLKDWQLYLGKLLSTTVPPLISSYLGMAVYTASLGFQRVRLPDPDLMVLILVLSTVQALVMVSGAVVVSTQATSVRAANLLASFIIIPMAVLIQGESIIMFWGDYRILWLVSLGLVALTFLLVRLGLAHFRREELLGREIDVLNLRWGWRIFKKAFTGNATTVRDWYAHTLPAAVLKLKRSFWVTAGVTLVAAFVGALLVEKYPNLVNAASLAEVDSRTQGLLQAWPLFSVGTLLTIWWQNVRALLIGMLLGAFSMGILGLLPVLATIGFLGYILGLLNLNGGPVLAYFAGFILPHGLLEVPAAILASAAVLQAGALLASPNNHKTVGEVWIASLGEWAKIMVGIVIPLLFVAAAIEAWLTPRIAFWMFK